jgi:hypothetical protein
MPLCCFGVGQHLLQVGVIKIVMQAALPRRYEETAAGSGAAPLSIQPIGGDAFSAPAVSQALQEAGHKVETEVLAPLQRWHEVYSQLTVRLRRGGWVAWMGGWRAWQLGQGHLLPWQLVPVPLSQA